MDPASSDDEDVSTPRETRITRGGLREGTTAPVFRLPRLDGGELSLLEYRGKDVVIVFSEPGCRPCLEIAPRLEQAHRDHPALELVVISQGEIEDNRAMAAESGLTMPIVLQRQWEISRKYDILSAPVAFHIDEWGVIAADAAVGPDAVLALVSEIAL